MGDTPTRRFCCALFFYTSPEPITPNAVMRSALGLSALGKFLMIARNYLARHAATLLRLARSTGDPNLAAALISKAADLKSKIDELGPAPDKSTQAPDVEPPLAT
jgi:hypothetical protein